MKYLLLLVIPVIVFSSCSMQKRKYIKGFYFSKPSISHSKTNDPPTGKAGIQNTYLPLKKNETTLLTFSNNSLQEIKIQSSFTAKEKICDTLILSNGTKMVVKVTDVNKDKIHYLLCDSDNEAEFYIETAKVKKVNYANGLTDELKNPKDIPYDYSHNNTYQQPKINKSPELEKARRQADTSLGLVLGGLLVFPLLIAGFVLANIARGKLQGQRGCETSYKIANVISIISYIFLGLIVLIIATALL